MKTGEDFRNEFPDTEEGFRSAAYQALTSLRAPRKLPSLHGKPILVFALLLAVLMGAAVAGTADKWSLFSSVPEFMQTASKDEQAHMKASFQPVSVKGRHVDLTVREAVYDGFGLYMAIDMAPHQANVFLIPDMNVNLSEPASEAYSGFPADVTLSEHIKALGYTTIYRVDVQALLRGMIFPATLAYNGDGTFTFYLRQRAGAAAEIQQSVLTTQVSASIMLNTGSRSTLEFVQTDLSVPAQPVLEVKRSAEDFSVAFENSGVKLTNITLQRTLLTTYVSADVAVINEEAFANEGVQFYFCVSDQDGARLLPGYFNISGTTRNLETGAYEYASTLSLDNLPDTLYMTEYAWRSTEGNKPLYTLEIPLQ